MIHVKRLDILMRFSGKSTIITGAESGIGRGTAIAFACEGARVMTDGLDEE
jgi:NAD(P)-dependent dehydrogenase (short-subunit alcohol dehydrogenase family)